MKTMEKTMFMLAALLLLGGCGGGNGGDGDADDMSESGDVQPDPTPDTGPDPADDLAPDVQEDPAEDVMEEEVVVIDCTGHPDFTPCVVITDPDRDYDICIDGTCFSPGCGDATCNPPGPHFTLPDTNQRTCYDGGGGIMDPCPGTPGDSSCATTDWCGQDAQYGWDTGHEATRRFTVLAPGPAGQPVILDQVTGLEWQGCPAGLSGSDCATGSWTGYSWQDALAYCDGLTWGGFNDWRLEDRYELQSIVDFGRSSPSIDTSAFPGTPSDWFWSISSCAGSPSLAWLVYFGDGNVNTYGKYDDFAVRCVRLGETGGERLTRAGSEEPVVLDNVTGLAWQGCAAGQSGSDCATGSYVTGQTWQNALSYCEGLDWGGHEDWYLPDIQELASIVDDSRIDPSIDTSAFPGTPPTGFWSSSSNVGVPSSSWIVSFYEGRVSGNAKVLGDAVRCVRRGP